MQAGRAGQACEQRAANFALPGARMPVRVARRSGTGGGSHRWPASRPHLRSARTHRPAWFSSKQATPHRLRVSGTKKPNSGPAAPAQPGRAARRFQTEGAGNSRRPAPPPSRARLQAGSASAGQCACRKLASRRAQSGAMAAVAATGLDAPCASSRGHLPYSLQSGSRGHPGCSGWKGSPPAGCEHKRGAWVELEGRSGQGQGCPLSFLLPMSSPPPPPGQLPVRPRLQLHAVLEEDGIR